MYDTVRRVALVKQRVRENTRRRQRRGIAMHQAPSYGFFSTLPALPSRKQPTHSFPFAKSAPQKSLS